jgi:adenylate kinase
MKFRTILLFGAPGAGKGTQGKILGTIPNYFHCACGDVFRNLDRESEIGRICAGYTSRGELVPDDLTVRIWREFVEGSIRDGHFRPEQDTLVLDGIPRNPRQAEMLKDTIEVVAIIYLRSTNPDNLIQRLQSRALKEKRPDDANVDVIRHRLKTYEKETRPVLNCYGKPLVHRINADQTPARVLFDILRRMVKI